MISIIKNRYFQVCVALLLGVGIGVVFYPSKKIKESFEKEISLQYEKKISILKNEHKEREESLQDRLSQEESSRKEYEKESTKKIDTLKSENKRLSESSKRKWFKLIKPDGTVIEKEYEENNREEVVSVITEIKEEFNEKIKSTEEKWKKTFKERLVKIKDKFDLKESKMISDHKKEIEKVKSEKMVSINEKKMRIHGGYTTDKDVRAGMGYSLWGPISIETSIDKSIENGISNFSNSELYIGLGLEI